jgi:hypothetical protein
MLQDGFHAMKFFVNVFMTKKSDYEYKFVIANKIIRKYYDIIIHEGISSNDNNIFYTLHMYKLKFFFYTKLKLSEISKRLFVFGKKYYKIFFYKICQLFFWNY